MVALVVSAIMFAMFLLVAILAFQAGDMHGTEVGLGVMVAMGALFVFEWIQRRKEKSNS